MHRVHSPLDNFGGSSCAVEEDRTKASKQTRRERYSPKNTSSFRTQGRGRESWWTPECVGKGLAGLSRRVPATNQESGSPAKTPRE
ncbi:hypothetical protein SKAU_G00125290 [Synaphobranchus kaupii]|uniref:Uncharacterized protein n=1 Tax=Synaphobranchus kaupii TaxID=118154 RepID=A0A9Q1FQ67_SYNKA|nr:hypothetical protein SKAU_G00125290 [Synaphobranchus kaupii]